MGLEVDVTNFGEKHELVNR